MQLENIDMSKHEELMIPKVRLYTSSRISLPRLLNDDLGFDIEGPS
jgi:hypothetical protein